MLIYSAAALSQVSDAIKSLLATGSIEPDVWDEIRVGRQVIHCPTPDAHRAAAELYEVPHENVR